MLSSQEDIFAVINKLLNQKPFLRKGGAEHLYFCPMCKHRKRKLEISISGKYHCWTCGFSGKSFYSLFKKLNAPKECYSTLKDIGFNEKYFKKPNNKIENIFKEEIQKIEIKQLPSEFKPLCEYQSSLEYKNAAYYLKKRGITKTDILRYNIGYCEQGIYAGRIIIPSYDEFGKLNFFSGRSYYKECGLKYKNCNFSKNIIGFESTINWNEPITIVESPFNAITIRYNCIPLFGKTMSHKLMQKLAENTNTRINVCLDLDAESDTIEAWNQLFSLGTNNIYFVKLTKKDPNEIGFFEMTKLMENADKVDFKYLLLKKMSII